jgi:Predicted flavin-nucleotide-binding protein
MIYPYAVPLSYVYDGSSIYFHAAKTGHKIDAVKRNNKASFCIIGQDDVVPEKYTTNYKSIIAFGKIRILDDEGEKRSAIEKLAVKYSSGDKTDREAEIKKEWDNLCMLELQIDYITGKESIELTKIK